MKSYVNYATCVTAGLLLFGAGLYLAPTLSSFTSIASYAHKPKSLKFSKTCCRCDRRARCDINEKMHSNVDRSIDAD